MQIEIIHREALDQAEARLPRWMAASALVVVVASLASAYFRFAAGFALGAVLAILAYSWLRQAVAGVLNAGESRVPKRMVLKFAIRYPLALGTVYVFYRTDWLPFGAILAGFFVPVAGVILECLFQLVHGTRQ